MTWLIALIAAVGKALFEALLSTVRNPVEVTDATVDAALDVPVTDLDVLSERYAGMHP